MRKTQRHDIIKKIIRENEVVKQEDLVQLLHQSGVEVTQATVSRDVKELQLIKVAKSGGGVKYAFPSTDSSQIEQRFFKLLRSAFISIKVQNEQLFIELRPGNGPSICSTLKQVHYGSVFAALSDDSGVLVICKDEDHAKQLKNRITKALSY